MEPVVAFALAAGVLGGGGAPPAAGASSGSALPRAEMVAHMVALTGLPAPQVVGFGDGVAAAVTGPQARGGRTGLVKGVPLRAETIDETAAAALGWRSLRAIVDIDCVRRTDLVRTAEVFAAHDLKGPSRSLIAPGKWGQPDPHAFLGSVIAAVCAPRPSSTTAKLGIDAPRAPAPRAARQTRATAVQIASVSSAADARRALLALPSGTIAGLAPSVARARVRGRTVYRALLTGFADPGAATRLCATLRRQGRACFVR